MELVVVAPGSPGKAIFNQDSVYLGGSEGISSL